MEKILPMSKRIKTITLFKSDISDRDAERCKYNHTVYDMQGNLMEEHKFTLDGEFEDKTLYRYNDKGKLIEEVYYYEEEEIAQRKVIERDENERIILEFMKYSDGSEDVIHFHYDDSGRLVEKVTIDGDGNTEEKEIFEYEGNRVVSEKMFDEELNLVSQKDYQYDKEGRVIKSNSWDKEDEMKIDVENEYDEKGNLVRSRRFMNDRLIDRNNYSYDEKNRISKVVEESERGVFTFKTLYDERDNAVKQEILDASGKVVNSVEREYDEHNNVLQSRVFIDGQNRTYSQNYILYYEYDYYPGDTEG